METKQKSWWQDFQKGLQYYRTKRLLVWLAGLISLTNFAMAPLIYVYFLIFASEVFMAGVAGYGFLQSSLSVGFVLGATVMSIIGQTSRRRELVLSSIFFIGLSVLLFSLSYDIFFALLFAGLIGFAVPFTNITVST